MKSTSDILSQWHQMINIIMQLNENLYMDDFKGAFFLKQLVIARKFPTRSSPFRTTHVFGDTPFVKQTC